MNSSARWVLGISFLATIVTMIFVGIVIGYYGIQEPPAECFSPFSKLTEEQVRRGLFDDIKPDRIRIHLKVLTNHSHSSGTPANDAAAEYIYNAFRDFGLDDVHYTNYDVLLSRPNESNPNVVKIINGDSTDYAVLRNKEQIDGKLFDSAYFAYSPQGALTTENLIYANLARESDFKTLIELGLRINGSVIIARYAGFRGDQVELSAKFGAKALLLFLDPSAVAPHGTNDSLVFPNGPWMPGSAMERGSVFLGKGDPLSQGFVSDPIKPQSYRSPVKDAQLPKIPALPIGYGDAQILFNMMDKIRPLPARSWGPSSYMNYSIGGLLPSNRQISVSVTSYPVTNPIRNIIGSVTGCEEPDRYVILGNHYDAWTMGGIDPNSGTAVMLELARALGSLRRKGSWCPRRTIILGAWDAEEYGLIGSTEWVEENLQILHERAVAYINIDAAVRGRIAFRALAMPLLTQVIFAATKLVEDPFSVESGQPQMSVYDVWKNPLPQPTINKLSAGSDYANFVNMVGISSADIRYVGEVSNPAYHTAFETFEYVDKFIDPEFLYHAVMGKVWIEIVRDLADSELLPFIIIDLATDMRDSWETAREIISNQAYNVTDKIDLDALTVAIKQFGESAKQIDEKVKNLTTQAETSRLNPLTVREMNDKLFKIERMFVDPAGLPGRPLIRHVLQAPSKSNAYGSTSYAGIMDCIAYAEEAQQAGDVPKESYWLDQLELHYTKVQQMVRRASKFLLR